MRWLILIFCSLVIVSIILNVRIIMDIKELYEYMNMLNLMFQSVLEPGPTV